MWWIMLVQHQTPCVYLPVCVLVLVLACVSMCLFVFFHASVNANS